MSSRPDPALALARPATAPALAGRRLETLGRLAPAGVALGVVALYTLCSALFAGGTPRGAAPGVTTDFDVYGGPSWLHGLMRWDGAWYARIATLGYRATSGAQQPTAFFPLFPALVAAVHALLRVLSVTASGFVVNAGAAAGAALLVARTLDAWPQRQRLLAVAALLAVPSAFFDVAFYSEGVFLLASALVVWATACRPRRLWWGALGAVVATLDRPPGVLLVVLILAAVLEEQRPPARRAAISLSACAGIPLVAVFFAVVTGSAFAFASAQQGWTSLRSLGADATRWLAVQLDPATATDPVVAFGYWEMLLLGVPLVLLVRRRHPAVALYAALSMAAGFLLGGVGTQSRYLGSLLPLWLAAIVELRRRLPSRWVRVLAAAAVAGLACNLWLISRFAGWRWAG